MVLAMAISFAACGTATEPADTDAASTEAETAAPVAEATEAEENEPVSLTYWYWADNTDQSQLVQDAVKAFNESNDKNITVTAEEYPWDSGGFMQVVFTAALGGGGPDISNFKLQAGKLYATNGLLADMSSYVTDWEDAGQITDSVWKLMQDTTDDGTTSILPWTLEPLYVYYRPSYFEMAGVEVPTTFEEFMDVVAKCTMDTDGDGKTDVYGYGMRGAGGGHEHLGNFLYPFGASWDDLTTPEAADAYKAYLSIFENGYTPESAVNAAYAELVDGFSTGLTAMIIHHIGSSQMWMEQFGDDVAAFVFPGTDKGQWTCAGDTELVVYETCENKDAAFEFFKFMTTGEGGTIWFKGTGKGLGTENLLATEEFANNPFQAVSAEALQYAGVLPPTDTLSEFTGNVWAQTNQQALLGQITPEDALAIMNAAIWGE
jgi:multiple sugar transport system substrate-binding protein